VSRASGEQEPRLRVDVLTLFPRMFEAPLEESLLGRAVAGGLVEVRLHDIRGFASDRHRQVDDYGFGGGPGMVLKPEPIVGAVEALEGGAKRVVLLSPAGRSLTQALVKELAKESWLVLICGRYEGVDERVVDLLGAEEVSIGDFVLAGGEVAALAILEAVVRLLPGVVGNENSVISESFEERLLDHPHYTRPREYRGAAVPDVLLSGDHERIARWRRTAALQKTKRNRPDLLGERPSGRASE
jgi:tRNA (guanine37-N1)-methyltransferase